MIPTTISTTTAGKRKRGASPRRNGAAKAMAATASKLTKLTCGIRAPTLPSPEGGGRPHCSPLGGGWLGRPYRHVLQPNLSPSLAEVRVVPQLPVDDVEPERGS